MRIISSNVYSLFLLVDGTYVPLSRIYHTTVVTTNYLVIFGGVRENTNKYTNDIDMYDTRYQAWSGIVHQLGCCNEVVETYGERSDTIYPFNNRGYSGQPPLPRAEHSAVAIGSKMYLFGGDTVEYGLMQDLYSFDTDDLSWQVLDDTSGMKPSRRAAHSMTTDGRKLAYIFGGRISRVVNGLEMMVGLNDLWTFDTNSSIWTTFAVNEAPSGRQHASMAYHGEAVYLYGGVDPEWTHSTIFNDMWVFRTDTRSWKQISPNSGLIPGIAPPPLTSAHLLPISSAEKNAFLLYGGVGTGGGTFSGGQAIRAVLGQAYLLLISSTNATVEWRYARMADAGGRRIKYFACEAAALSLDGSLLYEFGGARPCINATPVDDSAGGNHRTGNVWRDSGSVFPASAEWLSNVFSSERLREMASLPVFETFPATIVQSPKKANNTNSGEDQILLSGICLLREFRVYSISAHDIILLSSFPS